MFKFTLPIFGNQIAVGSPTEGLVSMTSALSAKVIRASDNRHKTFIERLRELRNLILRGDRNDYGVICRKMVTTKGVTWIACLMGDSTMVWTGAATPAKPTVAGMKYHYWGSGAGTPAITDTISTMTLAAPTDAMESGVAGNYSGATSGNNAVYTSVAEITAAGSVAITEHAIGALANTDTSSVVLDRHTFGAINLVSGDKIQFTYTLTLNSGGA